MNQKIDNRTTSGFLAIVSPFFQVLTFQCVSLLWKFNKGRKLSSKIVSYFNTEKYGNMTVKCIALYRFSVYFEATEATKACEIVAASYTDAVGISLWIISCAFAAGDSDKDTKSENYKRRKEFAVEINVPVSKEFYQERFFHLRSVSETFAVRKISLFSQVDTEYPIDRIWEISS